MRRAIAIQDKVGRARTNVDRQHTVLPLFGSRHHVTRRKTREHQLAESMVRRWREQYEEQGQNAWPEAADLVVEPDAQQRIRELEAALGRAHLEIELLRRALKQAEKGGSTPRKNGR